MFSARFVKQDEKDEVKDEVELDTSFEFNRNEAYFDPNTNSLGFQLEHQILNQETKDSRWRFFKSNSMAIFFYKTTELEASSYVKIPLRTSNTLKFKKMMNIVSVGRF